MTPEEKYQIKYWKVLKNIKDKILLSENDQPVEYKIFYGVLVVGHDEPNQKEEMLFLKKIENEGGIRIKKEKHIEEGGVPEIDPALFKGIDTLSLEILQPKFDEIYNKYKKINLAAEDKSDGKNNSQKINLYNKFLNLTNNQTFAIVVGTLIVLFVILLIYHFWKINLNDPGQ